MKKRKKLTRLDRDRMYVMRRAGHTIQEIVEAVNVTKGTVSKEFKRNRHPDIYVWEKMSGMERASYAQDRAEMRRSRKRSQRTRLKNRLIERHVIEKLTIDELSPEEIANNISNELVGYSISAKAIYNYTKFDKTLKKKLPEQGKKRRQRVVRLRNRFKNARSIGQRELEVQERKEFGHWEVDTIVSSHNTWSILTLIERVSRKGFYIRIPNLKADTVRAQIIAFFARLPRHMCKTITTDNGSEFAELCNIEHIIGMNVYYCDPYCSWQKGSVEYANRRFRRYCPKGFDFSKISDEEVKFIELKLDKHPRRCLGWLTSTEVFDNALNNPPQDHLQIAA